MWRGTFPTERPSCTASQRSSIYVSGNSNQITATSRPVIRAAEHLSAWEQADWCDYKQSSCLMPRAGLTGPEINSRKLAGPRLAGPKLGSPRLACWGPRFAGPKVAGSRHLFSLSKYTNIDLFLSLWVQSSDSQIFLYVVFTGIWYISLKSNKWLVDYEFAAFWISSCVIQDVVMIHSWNAKFFVPKNFEIRVEILCTP